MCTLSFAPNRNGLLLAMNRDEALTRPQALLPQVVIAGDVRAVYPSESSGGTWLAASDRGLILALLNRNGAANHPKLRSRGILIPSLIAAQSLEEVEGRLFLSGAAGMLPFSLLGFDSRRRSILEAIWDGERFTTGRHPWSPLHWFSSSLSDKDATAIRGRTCSLFHEHFASNAENFRELHSSHSPGAGAYSICVHRPGVGSVSYSEIVLEGEAIQFSYAAGTPCQRPPLHSLTVPLTAAGRSAA